MPALGKLQQLTRVMTSNRIPKRPKDQIKPPLARVRPLSPPEPSKVRAISVESKKQQQQQKPLKVSREMGENSNADLLGQERRIPLADVVADCTKRWFQDTLKEAKAGDSAMQVLVAQMYRSGYGVPVNDQKVFPFRPFFFFYAFYLVIVVSLYSVFFLKIDKARVSEENFFV